MVAGMLETKYNSVGGESVLSSVNGSAGGTRRIRSASYKIGKHGRAGGEASEGSPPCEARTRGVAGGARCSITIHGRAGEDPAAAVDERTAHSTVINVNAPRAQRSAMKVAHISNVAEAARMELMADGRYPDTVNRRAEIVGRRPTEVRDCIQERYRNNFTLRKPRKHRRWCDIVDDKRYPTDSTLYVLVQYRERKRPHRSK